MPTSAFILQTYSSDVTKDVRLINCLHSDVHIQMFTFRCLHSDVHIQMLTFRCSYSDVHIQMFTFGCSHSDVHIQMFTFRCSHSVKHGHLLSSWGRDRLNRSKEMPSSIYKTRTSNLVDLAYQNPPFAQQSIY